MQKYRWFLWIFAALSLLAVGFIFARSLQPSEVSQGESSRLADLLQALLDPRGVVSRDKWISIIRKTAHFVEFMALGIMICGYAASLGLLHGTAHRSLPLLLCMGTAVCDETIQTFVQGRSGMVRDVVLDFCGSITGILLVWLVVWLLERRARKRKEVHL